MAVSYANIEVQAPPVSISIETVRQPVASVTVEVTPPPASISIETVGALTNDDVTWATSDDCGTTTVTIPNLSEGHFYTPEVNFYDLPEQVAAQFTMDGSTGTLVFSAPKDAVFTVVLTDEELGVVIDKQIPVACRGYSCFNKINNQNASAYSDNLTGNIAAVQVVENTLRTAIAAFRTSNFQEAAEQLDMLAEICGICNCSCGC